jgi:hypothetical protein
LGFLRLFFRFLRFFLGFLRLFSGFYKNRFWFWFRIGLSPFDFYIFFRSLCYFLFRDEMRALWALRFWWFFTGFLSQVLRRGFTFSYLWSLLFLNWLRFGSCFSWTLTSFYFSFLRGF